MSTSFHILARPRRFGKSLFLDMMARYYDVSEAPNFDLYFHDLYIHSHPTPLKNSYFVLKLSFAGLETGQGIERIQKDFFTKLRFKISGFFRNYQSLIPNGTELSDMVLKAPDVKTAMELLENSVGFLDRKIFLLIDEYDNFANELLSAKKSSEYLDLTKGTGFYKTFFKQLKELAESETRVFDRIYVTGVSPLVLDDLTSGANTFTSLSFHPMFAGMLGFTEDETKDLLQRVIAEKSLPFKIDEVMEDARKYYNGYKFDPEGSIKLYNPDMVLYFAKEIFLLGKYPREILDMNVRSDFGKIDFLLGAERVEALFPKLLQTAFDGKVTAEVSERLRIEELYLEKHFFSLLTYFGLLTFDSIARGDIVLRIPNLVIEKLHWEHLISKLEKLSATNLDTSELSKTIQELAYSGKIEPFIQYFFDRIIGIFSNRDFIKMNEKAVKGLMVGLLHLSKLYLIFSEPEMSCGYADLILKRDARFPDILYNWIIELKYLKANSSEPEIEQQITEGQNELKHYTEDPRWRKMLQPAGVTLKTAVIAFIDGKEFRIVENVLS
ncbi:MAG: AAA family ATPase [Candidatus Riflebacteria bacterium]|nr:AAA family ATPase [Candidatus Riflebacteria bacterium]